MYIIGRNGAIINMRHVIRIYPSRTDIIVQCDRGDSEFFAFESEEQVKLAMQCMMAKIEFKRRMIYMEEIYHAVQDKTHVL